MSSLSDTACAEYPLTVLADLHFATYRAKPHIESFDDFVRGDKETQEKVFNQCVQLSITVPEHC